MKDMQENTQPGKNWYSKWHDTGRHYWVHWGVFLIVIAAAWGLFYTRVWDWVAEFTTPGVTVKLNNANIELALDPQTVAVNVGDIIATNIILDTKNQPVDGVDI